MTRTLTAQSERIIRPVSRSRPRPRPRSAPRLPRIVNSVPADATSAYPETVLDARLKAEVVQVVFEAGSMFIAKLAEQFANNRHERGRMLGALALS